MRPPGRIYQDKNFTVEGYEETTLEKLIGLVEPGANRLQPDMVYIKVKEKGRQQFFLDGYLGFWEDWGVFELEQDENSHVDLTEKFEIIDQKIRNISCVNGSITINFQSGIQVLLQLVDPKNDDSTSEIKLA